MEALRRMFFAPQRRNPGLPEFDTAESRRDDCLVPEIPGIVLDLVFLQEGEKLRLKIEPTMMFLLPQDVFHRVHNLGFADRECPISFLPRKGGPGALGSQPQ